MRSPIRTACTVRITCSCDACPAFSSTPHVKSCSIPQAQTMACEWPPQRGHERAYQGSSCSEGPTSRRRCLKTRSPSAWRALDVREHSQPTQPPRVATRYTGYSLSNKSISVSKVIQRARMRSVAARHCCHVTAPGAGRPLLQLSAPKAYQRNDFVSASPSLFSSKTFCRRWHKCARRCWHGSLAAGSLAVGGARCRGEPPGMWRLSRRVCRDGTELCEGCPGS